MLAVPKVFRHGERRMAHPEAGTGQLVHLPEDHHHVRQYARRRHLAVELLSLATTLADTAEETDTVVMSDHVVNHFGEQDGLSHAGTPEQPGFAAALQGHEHIDSLDAGLEDLALGRPLRQARG